MDNDKPEEVKPPPAEDKDQKRERGAMRGRYGWFVAAFLSFTVATIAAAIWYAEFFSVPSKEENIRAFLAFVFASGTIVIVFLATLFICFADEEDYEQRFDGIKYILSILIAVLGTITGFYFGAGRTSGDVPPTAQTTQTAGAMPTKSLVIANARIQPDSAGSEDEATFSFFIDGGTAPYSYTHNLETTDSSFTIERLLPKNRTGKLDEPGEVRTQVDIPATGLPDGGVEVTVSEVDSGNANVTVSLGMLRPTDKPNS